jgi:hypothetical protein
MSGTPQSGDKRPKKFGRCHSQSRNQAHAIAALVEIAAPIAPRRMSV